MSQWAYAEKGDLELDGDELNVRISTDHYGNNYLVIDVAMLKEVLTPNIKETGDKK